MIYGYARVSTKGQERSGNSLSDQLEALKRYGCGEIVEEAYSAKTMNRPAFAKLLERLQPGDTLVVTKLDRFARTTIEGIQTVKELFERDVRVHVLNMGLIENTLVGNLILTVMLAFAEYERGMIVERTEAGKKVARQREDYREGRHEKEIDEAKLIDLYHMCKDRELTVLDCCRELGISKTTWYIKIKEIA